LRSTGMVALFICSLTTGASANGLCEHEMARAARRRDVPLGVLYAVGLSETGQKGVLHPYALNIEGKTVVAADLQSALAQFREAKSKGANLIDLGCMQINHRYHGDRFASVEAMFDPAKNVDYAARFLKELRAREGSWTMAVARYNAGPNNTTAQRRYVCSVIGSLVASGFGSWTSGARTYCSERTTEISDGSGGSASRKEKRL
jgi:soluble lytic murein transglycosylase-like protein